MPMFISKNQAEHWMNFWSAHIPSLVILFQYIIHDTQGVISAKSVWEQSVGGKKSLWQNMAKIAVKSAIYGQICFK